MNWTLNFIVGLISAFISALGMGGGAIFLIYLTCILSTPQLAAQGMNLLFFIPISIVALIIHIKNKLIDYKIASGAILGGIVGVFIGKFIAEKFGDEFLRLAFGIFLLILGVRELFKKSNDDKNQK